MTPQSLDEISRKLLASLPTGFDKLPEEIKRNLRSALTAALARADLVTREEFDVQSAVLRRTREKLTALEETVSKLEASLDPAGADHVSPQSR